MFYRANAIEKSPRIDMEMLKKMNEKRKINPKLINAMENKLRNHLWYFTGENIVLALFDDKVPLVEKRKMVNNMKTKDPAVAQNRPLKFQGEGENSF